MTIGLVTSLASSALANGIDLPTHEAMQGEEISVTGHAWLTCCPTNTPVEHVRLFLCEGPCWKSAKQVLLFDVAANEEGVISTVFTVPWVTPGRYRLEACGGRIGEGGPPFRKDDSRSSSGHRRPTPGRPRSRMQIARDRAGGCRYLPCSFIGGATAVVYFLIRRRPTPN